MIRLFNPERDRLYCETKSLLALRLEPEDEARLRQAARTLARIRGLQALVSLFTSLAVVALASVGAHGPLGLAVDLLLCGFWAVLGLWHWEARDAWKALTRA